MTTIIFITKFMVMDKSTYVSLNDLRQYLGITTRDEDDTLNMILQYAQWEIDTICEVDSFNFNTVVETISITKIMRDFWVILKNRPVVAIKKIDWTTYAWTIDSDYMIAERRKVIITDLFSYIKNNNRFPYFKIEYTYWYARSWEDWDLLPRELKQLHLLYSAKLYNQKWLAWFDSYSLWDESISLSNNSGEASGINIDINNILKKYRKINVV